MKTPEEIKEGLECCAEYGNCSKGCPYNPIKDCGHDLYSDALTYIQQLERERDAAVKDIPRICEFCKRNSTKYLADGMIDDVCLTCLNGVHFNWQWRGVQEVE